MTLKAILIGVPFRPRREEAGVGMPADFDPKNHGLRKPRGGVPAAA